MSCSFGCESFHIPFPHARKFVGHQWTNMREESQADLGEYRGWNSGLNEGTKWRFFEELLCRVSLKEARK